MTLPFHPRPGDPDADHLNNRLDAHRSGTRAPDPASSESTEAAALANAADQFCGLVHRADAPAAAYLDRHPLQNRWEYIMNTAFPTAPQHAAFEETFAPSPPVSHRTRRAITPQPPNRLNAWLSAAIVAVLLLGTIGGAWWLGSGSNGSNDDPVRLAAIAQEDATSTSVATPQTGASGPSPLTYLLSAVPARMADMDMPYPLTWSYVNIERRLSDLGFTSEEAIADPLHIIGMNPFGSAWTSSIFSYSADEKFVAAIGFNPLSVQQIISSSAGSDGLTLLSGDWDADTLFAVWESVGYTEQTTQSGVTIWTLGTNGEIDAGHPIQLRMSSQLNNVAILEEGILAYAGNIETIERVIEAHTGETESVDEGARMATLLATVPENTVSLFMYDQPGTALYDIESQIGINPNIRPENAEEIRALFAESREAVGPLPEYHGLIIGVTSEPREPGEEPTEMVFIRLGAESEEDALQIALVVEWRWQNLMSQRYQRPLNTLMTLTESTTDGTSVILNFDPMGDPSLWMDLFMGNNPWLLAVDPENADIFETPVVTPTG